MLDLIAALGQELIYDGKPASIARMDGALLGQNLLNQYFLYAPNDTWEKQNPSIYPLMKYGLQRSGGDWFLKSSAHLRQSLADVPFTQNHLKLDDNQVSTWEENFLDPTKKRPFQYGTETTMFTLEGNIKEIKELLPRTEFREATRHYLADMRGALLATTNGVIAHCNDPKVHLPDLWLK